MESEACVRKITCICSYSGLDQKQNSSGLHVEYAVHTSFMLFEVVWRASFPQTSLVFAFVFFFFLGGWMEGGVTENLMSGW